jgi:two-component system cell cycle response regulator
MPAAILVIEDNPTNRELVAYLLGKRGHAILTAADGADGLRVLREQPVDLVLCDLQMPRVNGYELVREVRADAKLRGLAVLAVTALSMPGDRNKALDAGFDGYFSKPIDPAAFTGQVEAFLPAHLRSTG